MIELFLEDGVLGVDENDPDFMKSFEEKDDVRSPKS